MLPDLMEAACPYLDFEERTLCGLAQITAPRLCLLSLQGIREAEAPRWVSHVRRERQVELLNLPLPDQPVEEFGTLAGAGEEDESVGLKVDPVPGEEALLRKSLAEGGQERPLLDRRRMYGPVGRFVDNEKGVVPVENPFRI